MLTRVRWIGPLCGFWVLSVLVIALRAHADPVAFTRMGRIRNS
jgi:hypothetical protein